jgi:chitin synthase
MLQFAGMDLTNYFPPPMVLACPGLVTDNQLELRRANFTPILDYAIHRSGALQTEKNTRLNDADWYTNRLMPDLKQYYKGAYVFSKNYVAAEADGSAK